jgi:ribosomal protein S18 acetylase RimI-like enzyme
LRPASPSPTRPAEPSASIRPAEIADLVFVQSLCRRVFLAYGSYDEYVAEWFATGGVSTYVAERDGVVEGFCMVRIHPAAQTSPVVAELLAIAVVPEHQSRGFGKALLEKCFAVAAASVPPAREVRLSVAEGNARAQRMFARHGFHARPPGGVYPAGQRALFMVKTLESTRQEETR